MCHGCGKKGHLVKVCRKRGQNQTQKQPPTPEQLGEAKNLLEIDDLDVLTIHPVQSTVVKPIQVPVKVDNYDLIMELDTGASVSLISEMTYRTLWTGQDKVELGTD